MEASFGVERRVCRDLYPARPVTRTLDQVAPRAGQATTPCFLDTGILQGLYYDCLCLEGVNQARM